MKLSYWSPFLGVDVETLLKWCSDFRLHGVDVRATRPENGKPSRGGQICIESTPEEVSALRDAFEAAKVEIPTLLCYHPGNHFAVYDWEWYANDIAEHARLATDLGAKQLRLQAGSPGEGQSMEEHMTELLDCATKGLKDYPDIKAAFENHPGAPSAGDILKGTAAYGDPRFGSVFSPDHCFTMQEHIVDLIDEYAPWIAELSYADRRVVQEDLARFDGQYYYVQYETCLVGEGDLEHKKILDALKANGFDGYLALKWEKSETFGHQLPLMADALPVYADFIRSFGVVDD
jgi:sugar phosphate isomerase/epimerase